MNSGINIPIDPSFVRSILSYDPETGVFGWAGQAPSESSDLGVDNGSQHKQIVIEKVKYLANRLAWAHYYGEDPGKNEIVYIEGNSNAIDNLRKLPGVSRAQKHRGKKCFVFRDDVYFVRFQHHKQLITGNRSYGSEDAVLQAYNDAKDQLQDLLSRGEDPTDFLSSL